MGANVNNTKKKVKNILILQPDACFGHFRGGSFVQACFYEKFLKTKGYRVSLFRGRIQESFVIRVKRLFEKIKKNDLLISFGAPFSGWVFSWFCWFFKRKGIFCLDTGFETKSVVRENISKIPLFTIRFALNDLVKQILVSCCFFPKGNLKVLASCEHIKGRSGRQLSRLIEGVVYPVVPVAPDSKKDKEKIRKKAILFCGHLAIDRGIIALIKACQKLWDRGYKFRLLILGYPASDLGKKELLKLIRIADNAKILGKTDNFENYLKKATMVVLPFRYPASFQPPLTLLEPMGQGTPVITTPVGANTEWLIDERTGLICNVKDPESVAAKIELLLSNPKLGAILAKNAKDYLRKKYAEENQLFRLIKEVFHER